MRKSSEWINGKGCKIGRRDVDSCQFPRSLSSLIRASRLQFLPFKAPREPIASDHTTHGAGALQAGDLGKKPFGPMLPDSPVDMAATSRIQVRQSTIPQTLMAGIRPFKLI